MDQEQIEIASRSKLTTPKTAYGNQDNPAARCGVDRGCGEQLAQPQIYKVAVAMAEASSS
ncbi:MAG: hypothetical protein M3290_05625, partial [Actinomycetota bacterium]|nr:hypothetical protein [Actinomycetota bacterium]